MKNKISAVLFLIALSMSVASAQTNPSNVSVAEAERRIGAHIKQIENRAGEMTAAFYYSGAQGTLEAAFRKGGVKAGMMYADSWGKGGIGLFWSGSIRPFYERHLTALNTSLKNIRAKGGTTKADLDRLDNGMKAWKERDAWFAKQFGVIVDLFVKSALIHDGKEVNEAKYGAEMRAFSDAKQRDKYYASKEEWAKANKPLDEQNAKLSAEMAAVKDEMAKKAAEQLFDAIEETPCVNGTERLRPDIKQTKTWVLAESVEFTKGSAAYLTTDKKVLKTLSTATEILEKLAKLTKADDKVPSVMKIPMKYFKEILKVGNEIVQAGGRLSDEEKRKLVDLVIRIERVEVTVECVAVEVCENGKWVRKGMKPQGEPVRKKLAPLIIEEPNLLAGELWKRFDKHTRSYAALQERFEADPCAGTQPPPAPPPANDKKAECDKLRGEIDGLKKEVESMEAKKADEEKDLARAQKDLDDWNRNLDIDKKRLDDLIKAAKKELKAKEQALKIAKDKKASIDENPNIPNREEMLKQAADRLTKAEDNVKAGQTKVKEAQGSREELEKGTDKRAAEVRSRKGDLAVREKEIGDKKKKINELQVEYNKCAQ